MDKHPEGTTWEKRREECDAFEQRLGDKVQHARDTSENLDEFAISFASTIPPT